MSERNKLVPTDRRNNRGLRTQAVAATGIAAGQKMSASPLRETHYLKADSKHEQKTAEKKGWLTEYRKAMLVRFLFIFSFTIADWVALGLNRAWNFYVGTIIASIAAVMGMILLAEALYRFSTSSKMRLRVYVVIRNVLTLLFCIGTVMALLHIIIHATSNAYLDLWPPSCLYGLDIALHYSNRDGRRACARIASTAESAIAHGNAQDVIQNITGTVLPPVYNLSQVEVLREFDVFLDGYTPFNQVTLLQNESSGDGRLVIARVLSAVWGFPDYVHLNLTTCTNPSLAAGTLIQMQSQQAFGYADVLVNARRVANFFVSMQEKYTQIGTNLTCNL